MDADNRFIGSEPRRPTSDSLRLVVMGTGPFAVPMFERLLADRATSCRAGDAARSAGACSRLGRAESDARSWLGSMASPSSSRRMLIHAGCARAARGFRPPICSSSATTARFFRARLGAGAARRHQSARLAAAEISRRGPDPMGHLSRRNRNRRERDPHDAALGCRPGAGATRDADRPDRNRRRTRTAPGRSWSRGGRRRFGMLAAGKQSARNRAGCRAGVEGPAIEEDRRPGRLASPGRGDFQSVSRMQPWPKIYSFWHSAGRRADAVGPRSIAVRPASSCG